MSFYPYAPNKLQTRCAPATTAWRVIASDGTVHASIAAMTTAGKTPWPGVSLLGGYLQLVDSTGVADGNKMQVAFDLQTAPTSGFLVRGTAGGEYILPFGCTNVWVKLETSTDLINLIGNY